MEEIDTATTLAQPDPAMRRIANDRRIGMALDRDDVMLASGRTALRREMTGKLAAAGDDAELIRHAPFAADRWNGWNPHG